MLEPPRWIFFICSFEFHVDLRVSVLFCSTWCSFRRIKRPTTFFFRFFVYFFLSNVGAYGIIVILNYVLCFLSFGSNPFFVFCASNLAFFDFIILFPEFL